MTNVRDAIRAALRRSLGLDVVRVETAAGAKVGLHLADVLSRTDTDLVLDVGAHTGDYGALLRRESRYRGHIVSFEPVAEVFRELEARAHGDDRWEAVCIALGVRRERREMSVAQSRNLSSLSPPTAFGRSHFLGGSIETIAREMVEVAPLDEIAAPYVARSKRVFLKVDTQGWDSQVLAGGERTLAAAVGLQIELSLRPAYESSSDYLETLADLRRRGFTPTGFFAVTADDSLRLVEADCVLVRTDS